VYVIVLRTLLIKAELQHALLTCVVCDFFTNWCKRWKR